MSVRSELVRKALYAKSNVTDVVGTNKLSAIYDSLAPTTASFPYGIIQRQGPEPPLYAFGQTVLLEGDVWVVKVVTDIGTTAIAPQEHAENLLATWVSTLGTTLSLSGASVAWMSREADIPGYQEPLGDRWIYHRGTQLRIRTE